MTKLCIYNISFCLNNTDYTLILVLEYKFYFFCQIIQNKDVTTQYKTMVKQDSLKLKYYWVLLCTYTIKLY